eukprot:PhM_4_TR8090/c0_g1_i1/m.51764
MKSQVKKDVHDDSAVVTLESAAWAAMFGEPDEHTQNAEEKANVFSLFTYSYITPLLAIGHARRLEMEDVSPLGLHDLTYHSTRRFVAEWVQEVRASRSWDVFVGKRVFDKKLPSLQGLLKWVGKQRYSKHPKRVTAGVEWEHPSQERAAKCHDGTAEFETHFTCPNGHGEYLRPKKIKLADEGHAGVIDPRAASLLRALWRSNTKYLVLSGLCKLVNDITTFGAPVLMQLVIEYLDKDDATWGEGILLCALMFVINQIQSFMINKYFHIIYRIGVWMRASLAASIYMKSFDTSVSVRSHPDFSCGRVSNLMSSDAERANDVMFSLHSFWSAPLQVTISIILLYRLVGVYSLLAVLVMALVTPSQTYMMSKMGAVRGVMLKVTDSRVKATLEMLLGIRIVKYMAWENNFVKKILGYRRDEIALLAQIHTYRVLAMFVTTISPMIVGAVVLGGYSLSGEDLTADIIFPTITILGIMRFPFFVLPTLISTYVNLQVSAERMQGYLEAEGHHSSVQPLTPEQVQDELVFDVADADVSMTEYRANTAERPDGTKLDYHTRHLKVILHNINVKIRRGKLHMVVGPTGSGKSTLLNCLLGNAHVSSGSVHGVDTMAYVPQEAWIFNASLRENVTFHKAANEELYERTVDVCQLRPDVEQLPDGDDTEIGEKGINVSGGQKQRISMARAVFSERDVLLLDDPLSAVDAHVGHSLFHDCICGALEKTTRVLVTHQVHFMPFADSIILVKDGRVVQGTYDEIVAQHPEYDQAHLEQEKKKCEEEEEKEGVDLLGDTADANKDVAVVVAQKKLAGPATMLVAAERREEGAISISTYLKYVASCGGNVLVGVALFVFIVAECVTVAINVWLSLWSNESFDQYDQSDYLVMYLTLIVGFGFGVFFRLVIAYSLMRLGCTTMHGRLLVSIAQARVAFFDVTPVGRILNRFAQDIDSVDNLIPLSVIFTVTIGLTTLSTAVMVVVAQWFMIGVLLPCSFAYYKILVYFNDTQRSLKRLDSVNKSPVFSHFTETLSGIDVIKAYGNTMRFLRENRLRLDNMARTSTDVLNCNRWLGIRLEFLGNIVVLCMTILCVVDKMVIKSSNVGMMALGITYALQVTNQLQWMVRQMAEIETHMNSVERIWEYIETTPHEDNDAAKNNNPVPTHNEVEFRDVRLRYRPELPEVLKGVSFHIKRAEKIGVVGRTGSGKSTLMQALFRMVDVSGGAILVGGVDTATLPVQKLRLCLTMVPQDPVLFQGTLRSNLDPFNDNTNEVIDAMLERVGMYKRIHDQNKGLETEVSENGQNFSVGERQLLCLARAMLKKDSGVILMDEATASVDMDTDRKIQHILQELCTDYTVITIAHRLHTVTHCDRILVMDQGLVGEFDTPYTLSQKEGGIFQGMLRAQGPSEHEALVAAMKKKSEGVTNCPFEN